MPQFYLHHEIDSEDRLRTILYDKRYYFNFPIVNFPFRCSNIPCSNICIWGIYLSVDPDFPELVVLLIMISLIDGCC